MRRYRSQRIQKTLIALSGAALASSMLFTNAQNISQNGNNSIGGYNYYQTKINSQIQKATKAEQEQKHKNKKQKIKEEN